MTGGRGQTSLEFLIGVTFVLFILVLSAVFASQKSAESDDLKIKIDGKRVCTSFADNINNIAEQGNGFYKYFSLPQKIYGDNNYNITVYGNWVEITTGNYTWSKQTISSNITVKCLDKGLTRKNKIYNELERIYIICDKPELRVVNDSLRPISVHRNQSVNISFQVMNFGPVDAGRFNVSFNETLNQTITKLGSEEKAYLIYNITTPLNPGFYIINITLDPQNQINESIEENNVYNATLRVI
jgi:uncharacterized protein (UPF0333 family)